MNMFVLYFALGMDVINYIISAMKHLKTARTDLQELAVGIHAIIKNEYHTSSVDT